MATVSERTKLKNKIYLLLGKQMVDVELDHEHIDLAIDNAFEILRQKSDGGNLEKDMFIQLVRDQQEYTLPDEVQEVRRLYRRGIGPNSQGGVNFDPATAAVYNVHMMHPGYGGGLATWDLYNGYLETAEKVFASQYNFTWDVNNKKLTLIRRPLAEEEVCVRVYVRKSDDDILVDPYAGPWIRQYATAQAKYILGEARDKFPSGFAGPSGSVQFNGAAMKQEAQAEMEKLETQLLRQVASSDGYGFIIG